MEEKIFHCNLWNTIRVDKLALSIINTWAFQRLHYIKQTGVLYKVFPTATHTRFQHSLGVYHVTRKLLKKLEENNQNLGLTERQKQLLCIAGLVHDIGHGPFSHLYDEYLKQNEGHCETTHSSSSKLPSTHEERSCEILKYLIDTPHPLTNEKIEINTEEYEFICECICKPRHEKWYHYIVNNPYSSFDVDKIDYLMRDSKQIGIQLSFNIDRILENIIIQNDELYFCEKVKYEIEKMFTLREELHIMIYRHPKVEKYQSFLLGCMNDTFEHDNLLSLPDFLQLSDEILLNRLTEHQRLFFESGCWTENPAISIPVPDNQKQLALTNLKWFSKHKTTDV